jgi:hypothetical protein
MREPSAALDWLAGLYACSCGVAIERDIMRNRSISIEASSLSLCTVQGV